MTRKNAWQVGWIILTKNKGVIAGAIGIIFLVMFVVMTIIGIVLGIPIALVASTGSEGLMGFVMFLWTIPSMYLGGALGLGFIGIIYRLYCGQQCQARDVLYYLNQPKLVLKMVGLHLTIWGVPIISLIVVTVFSALLLADSPLSIIMIFFPLFFWVMAIFFYSVSHAANIFLIAYPDLPFADMLKVSFKEGLRNCGTYVVMILQVIGVTIGSFLVMAIVFGVVGVILPNVILPVAMLLLVPLTLVIYVGAIVLGIWLNLSLTVYYTAQIAQGGYIPDGRIEA